MKVLHVIPAVASCYGGPSKAIYEMSRSLQQEGCEVLVCTTDADGEHELPVDLGKVQQYEGTPTIFFHRQWNEAYKYSRPLSRWLCENVAAFDVVHIHAVFSHACISAARECMRWGIPYVVRPLGTLDPWGMRQKPWRKRLFMRLGVDSMLHHAAAIHYTADDEKRAVENAMGYGRGVVIPLGIDLDQFDAELQPERLGNPQNGDEPYVLVLSRLHHKKGLELLFESFISVAKEPGMGKWRLIIAGDGDPSYVDSLKQLVDELGGSDVVIFAGWLTGDVKIAALKKAEFLALPSHQENFGVCVLESLACGVPVLLSPNVNLAPDVLAAGAGWIVSLEKESLQNVLRAAMLDQDERHRRGAAGLQFAQQFAAPVVASRLISLYQSLTVTSKDQSTVALSY